MVATESPVIAKIEGTMAREVPRTGGTPKFHRIRCRTTTPPLDQFDLLLSEAAAEELAAELAKLMQARGSR